MAMVNGFEVRRLLGGDYLLKRGGFPAGRISKYRNFKSSWEMYLEPGYGITHQCYGMTRRVVFDSLRDAKSALRYIGRT